MKYTGNSFFPGTTLIKKKSLLASSRKLLLNIYIYCQSCKTQKEARARQKQREGGREGGQKEEVGRKERSKEARERLEGGERWMEDDGDEKEGRKIEQEKIGRKDGWMEEEKRLEELKERSKKTKDDVGRN